MTRSRPFFCSPIVRPQMPRRSVPAQTERSTARPGSQEDRASMAIVRSSWAASDFAVTPVETLRAKASTPSDEHLTASGLDAGEGLNRPLRAVLTPDRRLCYKAAYRPFAFRLLLTSHP